MQSGLSEVVECVLECMLSANRVRVIECVLD
jgi:hypothetical protein